MYKYKFLAVTIKTDTKTTSESREFRCENNSKLAQDAYFGIFTVFSGKQNSFPLFCYKNRNIFQFNTYTKESDFGSMSKIGKFRFENTLNIGLAVISYEKLGVESALKISIFFNKQ